MPNDDHDDMYNMADLSITFAPVNKVIGSHQLIFFKKPVYIKHCKGHSTSCSWDI